MEPVTLIWYVAHGVVFLWFSVYMSPIRHSDRANVTYFWTISFVTLLLLISSISHAPRLFHNHSTSLVDIVAFAWTVFPICAICLEIVSKISKQAVGYTITAPLRVMLSNTLLVTIALSLQYMTCIENGFLSANLPPRHDPNWLTDVSLMHCLTMESPLFVSIPIVATIIVLFLLSNITGRVFGYSFRFFQSRHRRHGTGLFDQPGSDQPRPVQTPMVPWFSLSLTATAIQLLVTLKIFVGRLDVRHILTAICKEESDIVYDLRSDNWIDFFADGGDGFNASYSIARLLAQPHLTVQVPKALRQKTAATSAGSGTPTPPQSATPEIEPHTSIASMVIQRRLTNIVGSAHDVRISPTKSTSVTLPRGTVTVHGGDLAYPRPNSEVYRVRFAAPLEAALPPGPGGGAARPRMFIVPGNHDHYDGLETFVHWIVGKSAIAGWKLPQRSSYFALQFRHGWWLLGLDIGLTNDLDVFQYHRMLSIVEQRIGEGDRVIVLTHRPQWLFDPYNSDWTGELFHQLLDRIGPTRLAMRLAGDIHNYSRHSGGAGLPPLVVSGGGGAFLHPTHVPEPDVVQEYLDHHWGRGVGRESQEDQFVESDSEIEMETIESIEQDSPISAGSAESPGTESLGRGRRPSAKPKVKPSAAAPPEHYRYRREATYPPEDTSRKLAWMNIVSFRNKNWGADIIFGTIYCCMGMSVLPICRGASTVAASPSLTSGVINFITEMIVPSFKSVYTDSFFSLAAQLGFFAMCYSGATSRNKNLFQKFGIALVHFLCHAFASVTIFSLIELCIEGLSQLSEGRDSIVSDGFRIPGLITWIDTNLFGSAIAAPFLTSFLRFVDFPSSLIRNRLPICQAVAAGSPVSREIMFRYIWRVLPFVWVLATPIAASIMGTYLFVNINYLGLHLNEAFSSLRIEDYKNFLRMYIDPATEDLHVYVVGIDQVARHWEEDPAWDPKLFAAAKQPVPPSGKWVTPSRWRPKGPYSEPTLVDYFVVPKIGGRGQAGLLRTQSM